MLALVPVSQLLLGSDFPARPASEVVAVLTSYGFTAAGLHAIERGNALRLMPRLKAE